MKNIFYVIFCIFFFVSVAFAQLPLGEVPGTISPPEPVKQEKPEPAPATEKKGPDQVHGNDKPETQPEQAMETRPPETKPKPKVETPSIPNPVESPMSNAEAEMLHKQLLVLAKVDTPDQLFEYIKACVQSRNYQGAELAMAFGKTKYSTTELKQGCLTSWGQIVIRLEEVKPYELTAHLGESKSTEFPQYSSWTKRRFRMSSGSIVMIEFEKDSNDCWQIAPDSIMMTDEILEKVLYERPIRGDWLSRIVPDWMYGIVLGLSYYQWAILALGLLSGVLTYFIVYLLFRLAMRTYIHVRYREVRKETNAAWRQVASICMAYVWLQSLSIAVPDQKVYTFAHYVFIIVVAIMVVAIVMKLIDVASAFLRIKLKSDFSEENVNNLIVPFFSRTLKGLAICLGVISVAHAFKLPVVGILSGLGIGGIAIAFAAKETVGNFFGSLTVLFDKPFEIGDWIITDGIEGTVETVGMRSTRIRTADDSLITIPNNNLTTAVINNLGKRRFRRFKTVLGVQYDTGVDRIDAFCEGVKELILKNPFTKKEGFNVSLYNLGDSAIEVQLNVMIVCPSSDTELRERAKLLRNVLKLAEELDVRFAFPTQTLYLDRDSSQPYKPLTDEDPSQAGKNSANRILYPDEQTG